MERRSQGGTEYLLIFAVALLIAGVSIYFLIKTSPEVGPSISVNLTDQSGVAPDEVKVEVVKVSETVKQADWQYCVWWDNEDQPDWDDAPEDLKAKTYNLTISGTHTGPGTYNVWLYHKPTKSVMFKGTVEKA